MCVYTCVYSYFICNIFSCKVQVILSECHKQTVVSNTQDHWSGFQYLCFYQPAVVITMEMFVFTSSASNLTTRTWHLKVTRTLQVPEEIKNEQVHEKTHFFTHIDFTHCMVTG